MSNSKLDILIITPPARVKNILWAPYGAMYIAAYLQNNGYSVGILNNDVEHLADEDLIERVRQIGPRYIGYSGLVATNYKYIKDLSLKIKEAFPDKVQILGGGLSMAAETLMRSTPIDFIVHGEGELTTLELLRHLDEHADTSKIKGLYYRAGSDCVYTGKRMLIADIDSLPYPAFDLVTMDKYLPDGIEVIKNFIADVSDRVIARNSGKRMINILTNRGCIGECSFCVRPDAGLRMHSVRYTFDFIEHCIKKFNVGFLSFGDECFVPNKARSWEFINEYKRRKMDFSFRILGMRVDTVDRDILMAYKDIGCWMINYGFESGSQKMLNIIDKRVTVEDNRRAALWTKEAGIYTPAQLILGMPGENDGTIDETIKFLKSLDFNFKQYKWTHALPIPGSPLYSYAKLVGAIDDDDAYLSSLGEIEGTSVLHVNLTDLPEDVVAKWPERMKREIDEHYFYRRFGIRNSFLRRCALVMQSVALHLRRRDVFIVISRKTRLAVYSLLGMKHEKTVAQKLFVQFRKKRNIDFEMFLEGTDNSIVNREVALKKINQRLAGIGVSSK